MSVCLRRLRASRTPCGLGGALEGTLPGPVAALAAEMGARGKVQWLRNFEELRRMADASCDVLLVLGPEGVASPPMPGFRRALPRTNSTDSQQEHADIAEEHLPFPKLPSNLASLFASSPLSSEDSAPKKETLELYLKHNSNQLYCLMQYYLEDENAGRAAAAATKEAAEDSYWSRWGVVPVPVLAVAYDTKDVL